jgi:hypothetical protein
MGVKATRGSSTDGTATNTVNYTHLPILSQPIILWSAEMPRTSSWPFIIVTMITFMWSVASSSRTFSNIAAKLKPMSPSVSAWTPPFMEMLIMMMVGMLRLRPSLRRLRPATISRPIQIDRWHSKLVKRISPCARLGGPRLAINAHGLTALELVTPSARPAARTFTVVIASSCSAPVLTGAPNKVTSTTPLGLLQACGACCSGAAPRYWLSAGGTITAVPPPHFLLLGRGQPFFRDKCLPLFARPHSASYAHLLWGFLLALLRPPSAPRDRLFLGGCGKNVPARAGHLIPRVVRRCSASAGGTRGQVEFWKLGRIVARVNGGCCCSHEGRSCCLCNSPKLRRVPWPHAGDDGACNSAIGLDSFSSSAPAL